MPKATNTIASSSFAQPQTGVTHHGSMPRIPTDDAAWLWQVLAQDAATPIFVVDRNGVVEYANAPAMELLRPDAGAAVVGRTLGQLLGHDHGQERLHHVHDALASGRTILMDEMRRGRLWRCTMRSLPPASPTQAPRGVLVVAQLASLAQALGQTPGTVVKAKNNDPGKLSDLTARELEILKLIGLGMSTLEIAKHLGRSVKTIEWHRVSLGEKLGVVNRVELARIAIAAGLVGLDEPAPVQGSRSDE